MLPFELDEDGYVWMQTEDRKLGGEAVRISALVTVRPTHTSIVFTYKKKVVELWINTDQYLEKFTDKYGFDGQAVLVEGRFFGIICGDRVLEVRAR